MSDSNWGPQDASVPKEGKQYPPVELFKSWPVSGFLIWHHGPLHWSSKRQALTAQSSAEAEIYAMDECTKSLQHITHILEELWSPINKPIPILNDNSACVTWSNSHTRLASYPNA